MAVYGKPWLSVEEQIDRIAGALALVWRPVPADCRLQRGDAKAAGKLADKYVKVPQSDPVYKKFSGFTDKDVLLGGLLTLHGTLQTDGRHEQAGVRTIRITGDEGDGGSLDVSLEGTPYPLRLVRAGSAGTARARPRCAPA